MPKVNPAILRWARETAGLDQSEAAERLSIRDARGVSALDRIRAFEDGTDAPSRPLLVRMAKQYRRPLLTFYLAGPPRHVDRGRDFRTLPSNVTPEDEPLLEALIRDVRARQSLIKSALLDEDAPRLSFVASATAEAGVEAMVNSIRAVIGLSLDEYRGAGDVDEAFALLRERTEEAGVFVLLLGNLGSHHTNIDLDTFRGFAIADEVAPFVVINDQDHHAAWSFTLLHELAHIWLGQTGVSGGRPELAIERFCNEVASELLLPGIELRELAELGRATLPAAAARIGEFASSRRVSHSMVAYKLFTQGLIDSERWSTLSRFFRDRWLAEREQRRERARESEGGPSYYVLRRHRLGTGLVNATARLMASGSLTTSKAATVLGVKPKNVRNVIEYRLRAS